MSPPPGRSARGYASSPPNHSREKNMGFEDRVQAALDYSRSFKLPPISDPGAWADAPIIGPGWEAAYDLQRGNLSGAALNLAMTAVEISPFSPALRVLKVVRALNKMRRGPLLAKEATQRARIRKIEDLAARTRKTRKQYEVHHTEPMKGADSSAIGLSQNHPGNLKVMEKATHRRLTGSWNGQPQFGRIRQVRHGTNALQKARAASTTAVGADSLQNALSSHDRTKL